MNTYYTYVPFYCNTVLAVFVATLRARLDPEIKKAGRLAMNPDYTHHAQAEGFECKELFTALAYPKIACVAACHQLGFARSRYVAQACRTINAGKT